MVYVLILNYNGRKLTTDCVKSVLQSDYDEFRILVIDNGSTDGSVSALRAEFGEEIDIIENRRNCGYAKGFNRGLEYGFVEKQADYCLVMNNDTIIDTRAITQLVKVAATDQRIGFVTGKVYYYERPNVFQTVGKMNDPIRWNGDHIGNGEEDNGQYDHICDLHFSDDIYTLVSRNLYYALGGYNQLFFLQGEEYDWQARAKEAGFRIMYTPYAKLWHRESMTIGRTSALKAYYDARNPMLVVMFHKTPSFFRRYLRYHLSINVIRGSIVALRQGNIAKALAKWQGFFSGIFWGLAHKKFSLGHFVRW
jgi:GT2 family glycosyltransferase